MANKPRPKRVRVPLYQRDGHADLDPSATFGADLGVNLFFNGVLVDPRDIFNVPTPPPEQFPITSWGRLLEIPLHVLALAATTTTGLYVITSDSTSATREIEVGALLKVTNETGVAGNPRIETDALIHTEASPVTPWTINHNLGRRVNVGVYTAGGVEVLAEVLQVSDNQATVTFDEPTAGYAVID